VPHGESDDQPLSRIVLATLGCLLALATSADADGVWILWSESWSSENRRTGADSKWEVLAGLHRPRYVRGFAVIGLAGIDSSARGTASSLGKRKVRPTPSDRCVSPTLWTRVAEGEVMA
jgi:hypothetical protein